MILRLDAVGFLWKETSTECLNLPQTHSIIKILRNVVDSLNIKAKIVTLNDGGELPVLHAPFMPEWAIKEDAVPGLEINALMDYIFKFF